MANAPRVLLANTTRWSCTARVAIALSRVGCIVSVICPDRHPVTATNGIANVFRYGGLLPLQSLMAAIESSRPQIVIPCDDRATRHLHELHALSSERGAGGNDIVVLIERSLGSPESYPAVTSRFNLLEVAREVGIRVPRTMLLARAGDLASWAAEQPLPWILKADGTWGGGGVRVANNRDDAIRFQAEMNRDFGLARAIKRLCIDRDSFWLRPSLHRSRPSIVVQSYVDGRPANCAFVAWKGRVLAGISVEVVSADGPTGPASVVRVVEHAEMMRCAERIARRLGLSGFFGLDFMIDDATDEMFLVEMNPRCTPPCHLPLGPGRDLIESLRSQLVGEPFRERAPVTRNELIAYFPNASAIDGELARSSFQDVPSDEPNLVQELRHPWPGRSLLYRIYALNKRPRPDRRFVWAAALPNGSITGNSANVSAGVLVNGAGVRS